MFDKDKLINYISQSRIIKNGKFILKSGKQSNYYIDFRSIVSTPLILKEICQGLHELIQENTTNKRHFLCGLPYAGIPYATTLSITHNIPMILLRKEVKKYGTKKMIEGTIQNGDEIIIIDDILTTGSSILQSLEQFKPYLIKKVFVIFDRDEGGKELLEKKGIQVYSLLSMIQFDKF